jgi:hypothetical protein
VKEVIENKFERLLEEARRLKDLGNKEFQQKNF